MPGANENEKASWDRVGRSLDWPFSLTAKREACEDASCKDFRDSMRQSRVGARGFDCLASGRSFGGMGEDRPAHRRISRGWGNVNLSVLMDPWTHQRKGASGTEQPMEPTLIRRED